MLGTVDTVNGTAMHHEWMAAVTENPQVGDTEVWEFYNFTADAHPMHVHEVVFEVVDRQAISFTEGATGPENVALAGHRHGRRKPGRAASRTP